ncbi:MAG: M48 family metalloprotease, partial [Thermoproteales archaeon]|nr:M48 family metalloprotease [Thermoproteales archaeon]
MAMREKVLLAASLAAVALIALMLVQLLLAWLAPGVVGPFGAFFPVWTWWIVDFIGYLIAITVVVAASGLIGRYATRTPLGIEGLRASMLSTSAAVLGGAVLVFAALASLLGIELTTQLGLVAFLFALVPSLISWLVSPALINLVYGCRHDPALQEVVNRVAARAGIKPPKAMVSRLSIPNAFAYSSPLMGRYVAVTEGMLRIARGEELEAVIGHELGHHKHRDNAVILVFGMIPSVIYFLGRFLMYAGLSTRYYYTDGDRERSESGGLVMALAGVALMAASILIQLGVLALSRLREFYADAHGAKVTSPQAMARALEELDSYYARSRHARAVVKDSKLKMLFI